MSQSPPGSVGAGSRGRLTVVICTRDRADRYLPLAIDSVLPQLADGRHELVIVDNASSDRTPALVAAYGDTVHYLREPRVGLSHARNTGWRAARHDYVAYLDDDAVAERGWVDAIVATLDDDPDVGAVGGPVAPIWEAPRPDWLPNSVLGALGVYEVGSEPRDVGRLAGGNAGYRRALLDAIGGFSPHLGRRGDQLIQGEDDAAFHAIRALGHRLRYVPAVRIRHHVPAARLTWRYLLRWSAGSGLALARFSLDTYPSGPARRGLWALRAARDLARPASWRGLGPGAAPDRRFAALFEQTRRATLLAAYLGLVR